MCGRVGPTGRALPKEGGQELRLGYLEARVSSATDPYLAVCDLRREREECRRMRGSFHT